MDDRGDHDQALKLYKESLQIQRDVGNEGLEAICLNNVGSVYSEKGQYEDALTYFKQALQLREKSKVAAGHRGRGSQSRRNPGRYGPVRSGDFLLHAGIGFAPQH